VTPAPEGARSTYGQILKSSVLIGGSQAFNIVVGIVRSKAIALLLGPSGFGLMGLYMSITNLAQSVAGMGINSSGVRQIAAAVGTGDTRHIARTAAVLRRTSVALGLLGTLLVVALSGFISKVTFDTYDRTLPVALLSLTVLFKVVSDGQGALIQGLRRITDLARIAAVGSLFGTVLAIGLVYFLRERGVVPALVAMAGMTLLLSWWYSRRVGFERPTLNVAEIRLEAAGLLKLGLAFMASGVLTMGAAYAVRMVIARKIGIGAAGLYQSAWTLGGLYVGFILQAMGADFYPRLTASIKDRATCNRLVNEQALVSLLLAGPGVIATLTFAPLVLAVFYSAAFHDAVNILRWICLGATLQVVTWPLGFIIVAEGRQNVFFVVELAYTVVYLLVAWVLVGQAGLDGAGIAFFLSYVFHGALTYPVVRWMTGFRWSADNWRLGSAYLALIFIVFGVFRALPFWQATALGTLAFVVSAVYSAKVLVHLVPRDRIPDPLLRVLLWARLASLD
jgi:antigen flippase